MTDRATGVRQRARAAWERFAWGLGELRGALARRGLWPAPVLALAGTDGARWRVVAGQALRQQGTAGAAPQGLLVAGEQCLSGVLDLPDMPRAQLAAALQEAMWRVSPLPLDQVASAARVSPGPTGGWRADWILCPRHVIDDARLRLGLAADTPVCLLRQGSQALAVRGPRPHAVEIRQRRLDVLAVVALLLAVAALAVAAAMPLLGRHQAIVQSMRHAATVEPMAAPLRQKLDELHQQAGLADALRAEAQGALPLAGALDLLARALPDDTWLDRLEVSGDQIRITGLTGNAAELVASLGRQPGLAEVRTSAPTVRDEARGKERFSFEMRWRRAEGPS